MGEPWEDHMSIVKVEVSNDELRTVRDAMRELNRMVDSLERSESTKFVLTKQNQMRPVVISVETFSALQNAAAQSDQGLAAAQRRACCPARSRRRPSRPRPAMKCGRPCRRALGFSSAVGRDEQVARKVEGLVVRLDRGSSNLPGRIPRVQT
jgi:hypothetical protein